jgi:hypothetical protein
MMNETYISFYLRSNRIHVFTNALREIGEPSRICFLIGENGHSLLMVPYRKRDFRSHHVPRDVYNGCDSMEISSMKLCRIIAFIHKWDIRLSYRVPGKIITDEQVVIFDLDRAAIIKIVKKNRYRIQRSDRETDAEE